LRKPNLLVSYSRNRALEILNGTRLFLRGMCQMKAIVVAPGDPTSQSKRFATANIHMQAGTRRLGRSGATAELVANAQASSHIYRAIGAFYSGNMWDAHRAFKAAAGLSPTGQRARALNNAGFAAFVQARLTDARQDYLQAYEDQPTWPYIKANVAYLDVAEGHTTEALKTFREIARDPAYGISSPQDVRLAEIMMLELEQGPTLEETNAGYQRVLRKLGAATWEFERDEKLRYGRLIQEVVNRIYLGGDYFGLEMFALTATCKAAQIVKRAGETGQRDIILKRLENVREALRTRVDDRWLHRSHSGWFSHLNACGHFSQDIALAT
jgi:Flp pilus assembly protein TadD